MSQQDTPSGIHTPNRVKHSYTQSINGRPEQVFPLLCPVGELDWAPGWSIDWVHCSFSLRWCSAMLVSRHSRLRQVLMSCSRAQLRSPSRHMVLTELL